MNEKAAIQAINGAGVLLVFPIDNRKEPASIWSHFFPRKKMRWEWDESGDHAVSDLWHLRAELSTTRKVVYLKWYRGRATYFSKPVFTAMLRALNPGGEARESLSPQARRILSILEGESPVSTKELKRMADLKGKANERIYEKAMQELWSRLLIVAFGEVEEGAFPSLAVGSTRVLFEDLWSGAFAMQVPEAEKFLAGNLGDENLFYRHYLKLKKSLPQPGTPSRAESKSAFQGKAKKIPKVVRFEDL